MKKLISWVEIPAKDIHRAAGFYGRVLDIELEVEDYGTEQMACFPGGEGAISCAPDFTPGASGALVSFDVGRDLNGAIDRVAKNGGKLVQAPTKIQAEGRGSFALCLDPEGNKIGLYSEA